MKVIWLLVAHMDREHPHFAHQFNFAIVQEKQENNSSPLKFWGKKIKQTNKLENTAGKFLACSKYEL